MNLRAASDQPIISLKQISASFQSCEDKLATGNHGDKKVTNPDCGPRNWMKIIKDTNCYRCTLGIDSSLFHHRFDVLFTTIIFLGDTCLEIYYKHE